MSSRSIILLAVLVLGSRHAAAQSLFSGDEAVRGNAAAGFATYRQTCMACHGQRLEGSPFGPTLIGQPFMDKWRGKNATELLTLMQNTMPPKGTAAARPENFPDVMAFLVRANLQGLPQMAAAPPPAAAATASAPKPQPLSPAQKQRLAKLTPVTESMLAAPPDGDWLMWRRTFDVAGFSPLKQIDRVSVQRMVKKWSLALDPSGNEITPLVHDGVLFVYSGSVLQAIDAVSGKPLWRYAHPSRGFGGNQSRMRSVAIFGQALFVPTPDGHIVSLDARSGKVLWNQAIQDRSERNAGVQVSSSPLIAHGVVIVGVSLGLSNKGGCFIVGLDANTGKELWRFHTIARPGEPDGDSWNGAPVEERFGGGVWTTGSYDPRSRPGVLRRG